MEMNFIGLQELTTPAKLTRTARNFDKVNLSAATDGKRAARSNVNKLEDDDKTLTVPASVLDRAS